MARINVISRIIGMAALSVMVGTGCATNISRPAGAPVAPKIKFSEYKSASMKHVAIKPPFDGAEANKKAAKKIDSELFTKVKAVFPSLKDAEKGEADAGRTVVIEPVIKEVKFIGGAARFWLGALAGSSAVLMQVSFKNKASGEVIAQPEFYEKADAFTGAWSMGGSDNVMLGKIADQICDYLRRNW